MEAAIVFRRPYVVVCCIFCVSGLVTTVSLDTHRASTYTPVFVDDDVFRSVVELQPAGDSVVACSDTAVQVNCTTETNTLYWTTTPPTCFVSYAKSDTAAVGVVRTFCDFEAILLSTSPSLMSTATLTNVNNSHNGTDLTCRNTIAQFNLVPHQISIVVYTR